LLIGIGTRGIDVLIAGGIRVVGIRADAACFRPLPSAASRGGG
jgi:hypothetical protein